MKRFLMVFSIVFLLGGMVYAKPELDTGLRVAIPEINRIFLAVDAPLNSEYQIGLYMTSWENNIQNEIQAYFTPTGKIAVDVLYAYAPIWFDFLKTSIHVGTRYHTNGNILLWDTYIMLGGAIDFLITDFCIGIRFDYPYIFKNTDTTIWDPFNRMAPWTISVQVAVRLKDY